MKKKKEIRIDKLSTKKLLKLIARKEISEEIPFDLIGHYHTELLSDWYPGYPGRLRKPHEDDPIRARGRVKDGILSFYGTPGLENCAFQMEATDFEGDYEAWVKMNENDNLAVFVIEPK